MTVIKGVHRGKCLKLVLALSFMLVSLHIIFEVSNYKAAPLVNVNYYTRVLSVLDVGAASFCDPRLQALVFWMMISLILTLSGMMELIRLKSVNTV